MILRRIALHVKRQDWFAVFLDFVIVVVGVFIGIQVANWNAERADDARAQNYLQRIRADLDADLANYEDRMAFWAKVSDYGARGLAYAESGDSKGASPWDLLLAFFQASQVAEFYTTEATFEELKSAGELGLIADTGLRDALAQYYSLGANPAMTERPAYRVHVREVIPFDIQAYVWRDCYSSDFQGRQKMLACDPPLDEGRLAPMVEAIRNDAALMGELRYWMSTMHVAAIIGRDRVASATRLHEAVEAELGAQRAP